MVGRTNAFNLRQQQKEDRDNRDQGTPSESQMPIPVSHADNPTASVEGGLDDHGDALGRAARGDHHEIQFVV